jgi:hypothetical protein
LAERQAERLRGLEVDDDLIFRRRLHRKVRGLLALEDAIDISSGAPVWIDRIGSIRVQTSIGTRNSTDRSQEACAAPRSQSAGDERWPIHCPSRSGHDRRSTRIRQRSEEFCNTFPQRADIVGATSGHSHGPPAGYGTTIVIGRDG